ncbi:MAG: N-acetyltransferase [Leifsonia xyli]|nr:MAG: N-acetyltransferase [Leifsonia xyli]
MTSVSIIPIEQGTARLRMLEAADLVTTLEWRNHPESRRWFLSTDLVTLESHENWFAGYLGRDDDYLFIVEDQGTPVAQVSLYRIRWDRGEAEFGRLLVAPAERGRGLSHLVTALCLRAAEQLGLGRLRLEVKVDNVRAIRGYERAGFRAAEGVSGDVLPMELHVT